MMGKLAASGACNQEVLSCNRSGLLRVNCWSPSAKSSTGRTWKLLGKTGGGLAGSEASCVGASNASNASIRRGVESSASAVGGVSSKSDSQSAPAFAGFAGASINSSAMGSEFSAGVVVSKFPLASVASSPTPSVASLSLVSGLMARISACCCAARASALALATICCGSGISNVIDPSGSDVT